MEKYAAEELNSTLCEFFAKLRKANGDDYEPDSLCAMFSAIDRHLKSSYHKSIKEDNTPQACYHPWTNSTYIPSTYSFDEILKSHCKFIESVGLKMSEEDKNLPYLYWTPKLHKVLFKHHFIAGSSKCTTKDLSCLLTKVLTTKIWAN